MLCILPFEERFYEGTGVPARFVGHPLAERPAAAAAGAATAPRSASPPRRTTIALVPGSRPSELQRHPPADAGGGGADPRRAHPDAQFVVPVAPTLAARGARRRTSRGTRTST